MVGFVAALFLVGLVACDVSSLPLGIQVAIDEGERSVRVGGERQLAASVSGGLGIDTGVRWSSRDPGIARVDDEGLVTGVAEGEVEVSATSVADPRASDSVVITVMPNGVLLPGDPGSLAVAATYDYSVPIDRDPALVDVDEDAPLRPRIHRGEIEIAFDPTATVGEVNALLEDLDARIVDMLPDHPQVIVRIPDPGSLADLRALIGDVAADPRVDFVLLSEIVEPPITEEPDASEVRAFVLPDGTSRFDRIDHHLALRLHAAWHVRSTLAASSQRPWLVVPDFYGDGRPDTTYYDAVFAPGEYATGDPHSHGYHVLGIMVGAFDSVLAPGTTDERTRANDDVTGTVAATLRVRVVDLQAENTMPRNMNRTISRIEHILAGDARARIVVNTSLGNRSNAEYYARSWTRKVRGWWDAATVGSGLEHQFLHFTAAGNVEVDEGGNIITWPAVETSSYTYAALGDMSATLGRDYPNLTNVLVVENRRSSAHGAAGSRPLAGCASDGSIMGGTLSAIGSSVFSFGTTLSRDPAPAVHDVSAPSNKSGTSMASPQAAGVAALVWSLAPGLTVPALRTLLLVTALDGPGPAVGSCNGAAPQPVVDAYAAVLAAGGSGAWRAILDVDGNGVFDEADLAAYLAAFTDHGARLSYDRFDLTGDGRSGSPNRTERVDLNGDGTYGTVSRSIAGRTIIYDETAVSDHDVLCYHAYSSLYQGSTSVRSELLDGVCAYVAVRITTPREGETISHTGDVSFRAELYTTAPGAPAFDPDLYTITWSYRRDDGERGHLGTVAPGATLLARPICRDLVVTAEARHRNVARISRDSVAFTLTSAEPGPWRTQVTLPASTPSYLNVNQSTNTLALQGNASRPTCAGPEFAASSELRWTIVGDTSFAPVNDATLTVTPALLTVDGSFTERTFRLRLEFGPATTHTVIPCSAFDFSSLRRCPDPTLQNALADALSLRFQDYVDAREARQALEAELRGLFDDALPEPFPLPSSALDVRLSNTVGSFEWVVSSELFYELFGLTLEADDLGFKANLLDLEVRASARLGVQAPEVLALFLAASEVAQATHTLFLPLEEGGADAWSGFLFASEEARASADVTVPVEAALNGFLTGYVETYRGDTADFEFEAANVEMSLDAGAIAGALAAIAVLEPPQFR